MPKMEGKIGYIEKESSMLQSLRWHYPDQVSGIISAPKMEHPVVKFNVAKVGEESYILSNYCFDLNPKIKSLPRYK